MSAPADDSINWARDVIARQAAQLTRLVDDLLDVSRITLGKIKLNLSPLDLGPVVAQAVEATQPLFTSRAPRAVARRAGPPAARSAATARD